MSPLSIPQLETERLMLRGYRESDVPAIAGMHADPMVMRFLSGSGEGESSLAKAWEHVALHLGHWSLKGYGKWAVIEKASGTLVGRVGYFDVPYEWPGLELGWTFVRGVWGRGYATEASRAALDWGFDHTAAGEILSMIHPENAASIRVAERLGERPLRRETVRGKPAVIYGISREAWQRSRASN